MLLKVITDLFREVEVIVACLVKEQLAGSYAINAPANYGLIKNQPKLIFCNSRHNSIEKHHRLQGYVGEEVLALSSGK